MIVFIIQTLLLSQAVKMTIVFSAFSKATNAAAVLSRLVKEITEKQHLYSQYNSINNFTE
jgi:hypothetical protein